MSNLLAEPTYHDDLGHGLIRRWSTPADQEKIGHLMGSVFRNSADQPLNPRAADEARIYMSDNFPFGNAGDIAIVEDTSKPDRPIVACTAFWRHQWSYAGIPFGVGRPENVATDPAYRKRGLVRALFAMFHARSAAEGHLVQAITGIPYYYRQFGYEFVLDLGGTRSLNVALLPESKPKETDRYHLRLATLADLPQVQHLYNLRRSTSLVWHEASEAYWRFHITGWDEPPATEPGAMRVGFNGRLHMIVDEAGQVCGLTWLAAKRWGQSLDVYMLELAEHVNWQGAVPALLHALRQHGESIPAIEVNQEPFRQINFGFGRAHPLYQVLGETIPTRYEEPYAWYLRVTDVPAFLRHIAPVLEDRLARSLLVGHTGELRIDFYRGGLRLVFAQGKLAIVEPWIAPDFGDEAQAGCPPLLFLQLLFGYRSLTELRATFPDVWFNPEAALLLNTLFPALPSAVHALSLT